jgi:hypothetical protein
MSMKKIILVALWLPIIFLASCSDERRPTQSSGSPPDGPAALSIIFEGDGKAGFGDDEKQLIADIITRSEKEVRALLPTLPSVIEVTAVVIDRNIDGVGGVTGRANAPGKVQVALSRVYPGGILAAARKALSANIFHEFHHLDRGWTIQDNKFGPGIAIAAVNEGLADVFSEEYTGVFFEEANSYPEHADEWLAEIKSLPLDANYGEWMGEHPDGRDNIGYRVGRYIIHQATANSGKDILELSKLTPGEVLKLAEASPDASNSP